jgi:hypothetical protein
VPVGRLAGGGHGSHRALAIDVARKRYLVGYAVRVEQVGFGDVFGARQEAVVVEPIEVVALVPGHLAQRPGQRDAERGMALVAAAFLPLAEVAGVPAIDRVGRGPVAAPDVAVVGHRLVVQIDAVAEHADGQDVCSEHRSQLAQ